MKIQRQMLNMNILAYQKGATQTENCYWLQYRNVPPYSARGRVCAEYPHLADLSISWDAFAEPGTKEI